MEAQLAAVPKLLDPAAIEALRAEIEAQLKADLASRLAGGAVRQSALVRGLAHHAHRTRQNHPALCTLGQTGQSACAAV